MASLRRQPFLMGPCAGALAALCCAAACEPGELGPPTGPLVASAPLALDRAVANAGETVTAVAAFRNPGAVPVSVSSLLIRGLPPGAAEEAGPFDDFVPVGGAAKVVPPGGTVTLKATHAFTGSDPDGAWRVVATYQDATGWHSGAPADLTVEPPSGFPFVWVDRTNARFMLDGKPLYFAATNAYYLEQQTSYGTTEATDALDAARAVGMRVVRTVGFSDGYAWTTGSDPAILQFLPGQYHEAAFQAMDAVIHEAAKRGLLLIIALVNNWDDYGGMDQYVAWTGKSGHDLFFTDPAARQLYKSYLFDFVNRVNTITGKAYRDDPTILGWELANEARCDSDPGAVRGTVTAWYREMATYLKSIDPNHLVATGEEGFDVDAAGYSSYSNGAALRGSDGTSFKANVALAPIDFGGVHLYPDAWGWTEPLSDGDAWIADHTRLARAQGKPLVLGEYGLGAAHEVYQGWLQTVDAAGASGAALWELLPASRPSHEPTDVLYPADAADVAVLAASAGVLSAK